jgi:uncharacterized protein YndB with AHSA1/START domain
LTRIRLSVFITAPIDEVFAFLDDPDNVAEFSEHAERVEIVDVKPDGRRTVDILMRWGRKSWHQTIEQVVREPPTRLATRGGTWTEPGKYVMTVEVDRRLSVERDGTRVDMNWDFRTHRRFHAVFDWLQRDAATREWQHQLSLMAERLAARPQARQDEAHK